MASRTAEELAPYLKAAREFPPLSPEEEYALAVRIRMGDVLAKQKLVRHNLAYVLAFVRKQRRGTVPLDDLIQEGNLGLLRAVDKFDPKAGARFLTYATWWIRAHVGKYLREARSTVRPPSGTVARPDLSLDAPCGEEEESYHLECIPEEAPGPEAMCLSVDRDREVRDTLARMRGGIGEMGWDIVQNRLAQDSPQTLEKIGRRWGLSRERARQVEARTKRLLQEHLRELEGDAARNAA